METSQTIGKLTAYGRQDTGKGVARKLRAKGFIPAVCYGCGREARALMVKPEDLRKALDPAKVQNTLIDLSIDQDGKTEQVQVLVKAFQMDRLKGTLLHADFQAVDPSKKVSVTVPLVLTGKAEGVKEGGVMHQVLRTLPVECPPTMIPAEISVDISALEIGDALRIKDLETPDEITIGLPESQSFVQVMISRAVEEEEEEEEEGLEGEEGAEGAEGAEGEGKKEEPAPGGKAKKD